MTPDDQEETMSTSTPISERAGLHAVSDDQQQGMFDREVENNALVRALDARAKKAEDKRAATHNYKNADERAKALIEELALEVDEVVRVGKYKIKKGRIEGGSHVEFTTGSREQLYISEIKD